jgi:anaerobic magnesium-protoporphyrin IX monomethyl ester cyclase
VASVLFAHGHLLRYDDKQFAIGKPYPPLATLYAAAHLRAQGHEVALYDPMLDEDTGEFRHALDRVRPDIVVLYDDAFNWFTKMCLGRMRAAVRAQVAEAHRRQLPVIVAGHDAADDPASYLDVGATFVIVGEAEITLGELVARLSGPARPAPALAAALGPAPGLAVAPGDPGPQVTTTTDVRGRDVDDIPGLVFRQRGFIRKTAPRKLLQDLDALALPAWDLVDMDRYRQFWRQRHGYFSLNVVTTRGCPYKCNWCAKPVYGNTYHSRSPQNVVDEIRFLRERYAPDHLWFCDDILGLKSQWLAAWSEALASQGLATPFLCQTRVDLMNDENVRALRRAGCVEAWLGAESGAQSVLDAMDKGITVEQTHAAVARLRAVGIRVGMFLQFGYPGEAWPEIQATRALVRTAEPDDIGISVSYPLPGTRFYERVRDRLGEKKNWEQSADLDPLFPGKFSRDFYQRLARTVHAEFRTRRGARAMRMVLSDPLGTDRPRLRSASELRHAGRWLVERVRLEMARRGGAGAATAATVTEASTAAPGPKSVPTSVQTSVKKTSDPQAIDNPPSSVAH